jgi:hypothetical protein
VPRKFRIRRNNHKAKLPGLSHHLPGVIPLAAAVTSEDNFRLSCKRALDSAWESFSRLIITESWRAP